MDLRAFVLEKYPLVKSADSSDAVVSRFNSTVDISDCVTGAKMAAMKNRQEQDCYVVLVCPLLFTCIPVYRTSLAHLRGYYMMVLSDIYMYIYIYLFGFIGHTHLCKKKS